MACFWHLHLFGLLKQHQAYYTLDYSSFYKLFLEKFLVWMVEMKYEYIHPSRIDEEINYAERLLHACGHTGAIGYIDYVHVGCHICCYTLKVQCTNTGDGEKKGNPSLVFQVVVSHTIKIQSNPRMNLGVATDITIYK
jgi:hypothetical protein